VTTLLKLSDEKAISLLSEKCSKCGNVLEDDPGDKHQTSEGIICGDCYFGQMGEMIDKNPICHPKTHHG